MNQDKTPAHNFDDLLAKSLRNQSPYIEDAGFTESVLNKLPANHNTEKSRRLGSIAALAALCAATPLVFSAGADIVRWVQLMDLSQLIQLGLVSSGTILSAAIVWLVRELDCI